MKIAIPHHTTATAARARVEELLVDLKAKHGHMIKDLDQHWEGEQLIFSFKVQGMRVQGTVDITPTDIVMDAGIPIFAKPFEPKIKAMVEREGSELFRRA